LAVLVVLAGVITVILILCFCRNRSIIPATGPVSREIIFARRRNFREKVDERFAAQSEDAARTSRVRMAAPPTDAGPSYWLRKASDDRKVPTRF